MNPRSLSMLLAATLLAACAADTPESAATGAAAVRAAGSATSTPAGPAGKPDATGTADALAAVVAARSAQAIGANPDRGDLVAYDAVRKAERRGTHDFHPVRVSEEHALAAIGSGTLTLTGPDGRRVELRYERHVEHPSGDWSWIGRDERGVDAVLTFGERAVFGVVPYGDDAQLRLTTAGGQAWMAMARKGETSPLQQRIQSGVIGTDVKVPTAAVAPGAVAAAGAEGAPDGVPTAAAGGQGVQRAMAANNIDVLIGYTPGFVNMMGGASQAQTRLNHIITVGNQAFANSNVDAALRLVHSMQVNYADTGSNENALFQVTGSNGSSPVTVPASLQPLRAARETYGADLVVLVRRFRDPDHEGCGIAWLLGADQQPIGEGHKPFGYSAISDSNGMGAPDNGHFCLDETLIHEVGHNMGSQHDDANARDGQGNLQYGRYAYSFGYKTGAGNGNFYTVMAYGDAGQTGYRIFSNPQSTFCGGRACGVANQADNARSLRLTAPVIAAFRASIGGDGSVRNDVDGDGRSDLVWRHGGTGANAVWLGGSSANQLVIASANLAWKLVAVDDFTGDGRADFVWRNEATGQNLLWPQGSHGSGSQLATVPGAAWQVVGSGDFDGDGVADLLWRNMSDGQNRIWRSANAATMLPVSAVPSLAWKVAGVGDVDGDGRADIVWRNTSNGQNTVWRGGNQGNGMVVTTVADQAWQVAGVDDFDGDGRADLLWRKSTTGENVIWRSANNGTGTTVATVPSQAWIVAATGDYDGDGRADILWRNTSTGANAIWRSANVSTQMAVTTVPNQSWRVAP